MKELYIKYLTNNISEKELLDLREYLKSPENKEDFKRFIKANQYLDTIYRKDIDTEVAYTKIENAINSNRSKKVITLKNTYKEFFKYAAVGLILLSSYFVAINIFSTESIDFENQITLEFKNGQKISLDEEITELKDKKGTIFARIQDNKLVYVKTVSSNNGFHKIEVPNGKIFTVVLPDGSKASINSGSSLTYFSSISDIKNREIFLEGEAYFDVSRNEKIPFIVHTNDIDIKVLGTKFNVTSYKNDHKASVFLEEGSVSVKKHSDQYNSNNSVKIKPKQRLVFESEKFRVENTEVEKHIAWKEKKLLFKDDTFDDIIKKIERYHNVSIKIQAPNLKDKKFTGKFTTESTIEILDVFKELVDFTYKVDDENATILITNKK